MKVKIIYRNYKPLHELYHSLIIKPPEDVSFIIPPPQNALRYLYPIYKAFGDNSLVRHMITAIQNLFLCCGKAEDDVDCLHFLQIIPKTIPNKPYVIDFEHVIGLADFIKLDSATRERIYSFLSDNRCHKVIPVTYAAQNSLKRLFPDLYENIAHKTEVIYPALPNYHDLFSNQMDYTHVSPHPDRFKLLFVGNDVYRKGLHELLSAFKTLESKYNDMELYVISDAPNRLKRDHLSERIKYFDPVFSQQDIIKKFFLTCDLFVMPTHCDTFGMVFLNSLSCGRPIVTTEQFAAPEIVKPKYNGLFVRSKRLLLEEYLFPSRTITKRYLTDALEALLVNELVEKIEFLYLNRDVHTNMSKNAIKDFEIDGKFSVDVRNRKLKEVYASCNIVLNN